MIWTRCIYLLTYIKYIGSTLTETASPTLATTTVAQTASIGCSDTLSWNNDRHHQRFWTYMGLEMNCEYYAMHYCENGSAKSGKEWRLGAFNNHPEKNCCICGKQHTTTATSTLTTTSQPKKQEQD